MQIRGRVGLAVTVALIVGLVSCSSGEAEQSDGSSEPTDVASGTQILTDAGLTVVADEATPVPTDAYLTVTEAQAERMVEEAELGGGMLGADLDALAPMPEGVPPTSYLLAGWLTTSDTPGAAAATAWLGDQDWANAPRVVFPTAVMGLFAADMLHRIDDVLPAAEEIPRGPDPTTPAGPGSTAAGFRAPGASIDTPCTAVTGFIANVLGGIVNALRIEPVPAEGIADIALNVLGAAWNAALGFARGVVEGLISTITQPVFDAIRIAVGVLSVATLVTSYIRDLAVTVTQSPAQSDTDTYRFAIDDEPDHQAQFVARIQQLSDEWPPFLRDCAMAAGAPLPQAVRPGDAAKWTVEAGGVITSDALDAVVGDDRTVRLGFITGRESSEAATGEARFGGAFATVALSRKELGDFMRLIHDQVTSARTALLGQVPVPLRELADLALSQTIDPLVAQLEQEIGGVAAPIFRLNGSGTVYVLFHAPPSTTTTHSTPPPPSTSTPDDFCEGLEEFGVTRREVVDIVPGAGIAASEELVELRPLAPAEYVADVDAGIAFFDGVDPTRDTDAGTLYQLLRAWGFASERLVIYCGITG